MSVLSSLMLILILPFFVSGFSLQQSGDDNMCKVQKRVLCVKDELMIIATGTKNIVRILNDIEKIFKQTKVLGKFNRSINIEMNFTHFDLPSSRYHIEFCQLSNIDKEYLNRLFLEAHYAMTYYYNSIIDLLNLSREYTHNISTLFKQIQDTIKKEIICRYRGLLNVYSREWAPVNEIRRIQFSRKHLLAPSLIHELHSVVIARYLHKWMEQINNVIINLEMKYF